MNNLQPRREVIKFADYGYGGKHCVCCGPPPRRWRKHYRWTKHRMKQQQRKEIEKALFE